MKDAKGHGSESRGGIAHQTGVYTAGKAIDWYERRHELAPEQVFRSYDGSVVKLDRTVPGDGTKWYVADWLHGGWSHEDSTIEPGDLVERVELVDKTFIPTRKQ
jgi:hypothetical protein